MDGANLHARPGDGFEGRVTLRHSITLTAAEVEAAHLVGMTVKEYATALFELRQRADYWGERITFQRQKSPPHYPMAWGPFRDHWRVLRAGPNG